MLRCSNKYKKNLLSCFTLRYNPMNYYQYNAIFANTSILKTCSKTPYMIIDLLAPYAHIHLPAHICTWLTSMDISFQAHRIQQMTVNCTLYSIFPLCKLADRWGNMVYCLLHPLKQVFWIPFTTWLPWSQLPFLLIDQRWVHSTTDALHKVVDRWE